MECNGITLVIAKGYGRRIKDVAETTLFVSSCVL
jgi:hypothetical protein